MCERPSTGRAYVHTPRAPRTPRRARTAARPPPRHRAYPTMGALPLRRREYGVADVASLAPAQKRALAVRWRAGRERVGGGGRSARRARAHAPTRAPPPPFQFAVLASASLGTAHLRRALARARARQADLCAAAEHSARSSRRRVAAKVAVDAVFARRLKAILAM